MRKLTYPETLTLTLLHGFRGQWRRSTDATVCREMCNVTHSKT